MSRRRALVVSPTPTHPADHGNRNRVRQMTAFLVAEGYAVDFVLYPMDADLQDRFPDAMAQMQSAWGGIVAIVPPSMPLHRPPERRHHAIDDWYDPAIDAQLAFLCARRRYDVMWVHYAFLSRAFAHAPPGCLKVLDTHDVLAGRRELFERHDAEPEFFQTTAEEEATALRRADVVVAIKPSEAAHFARLADRPVVTVPAAMQDATPLPTASGEETLRVGFIGADNRVNRLNLLTFLDRLRAFRGVFLPDLKVIVAGGVCRHLERGESWIECLGAVDDVSTFYCKVDLVIAPLAFSTGLKIKVAEALAWRMPVVALADAFDGFTAFDEFQTLPDLDAACAALMTLAADRSRLLRLAAASQDSADALRVAEAAGFGRLRAALAVRRRRLVIVTDLLGAPCATLASERTLQVIHYFAHLVPVTIVAVGKKPEAPMPLGVDLAVAALMDELAEVLAKIDRQDGVLAAFLSLSDESGLPTLRWPVVRDLWPRVASGAIRMPYGGRDIVLDDGSGISATPLRHLPTRIAWPRVAGPQNLALVIASEAADASLVNALWTRTGARVAVLRTASLALDETILASLASLPRPAAIVTIDADPVTRELAAALASWSGAAHFDIAGAAYPLLLSGRLVGNLDQHVAAIAGWLHGGGPPPGSERAPDAGWSVLWRRIEALLREPTEIAA